MAIVSPEAYCFPGEMSPPINSDSTRLVERSAAKEAQTPT
jgi:hypothetical protein